MAIDVFHTQIDSKEIGVEDLVLRLGMKLSSGVVTWHHYVPSNGPILFVMEMKSGWEAMMRRSQAYMTQSPSLPSRDTQQADP
jgi:hypothetical protein